MPLLAKPLQTWWWNLWQLYKMVQQSVVPSASGNIFRLQCAKSSMYTLFIIAVVVVRLLNARCVRFFVVVGDLTLPQHIPLSGIHDHCISRFMPFTREWYHQVFTLQHTTVVYCFGSSDFSPLLSLVLSVGTFVVAKCCRPQINYNNCRNCPPSWQHG